MRKAEALQTMENIMKMQRKSRNTIKVYLEWMGKYIDFLPSCKGVTHEEKLGQFLSLQVRARQFIDNGKSVDEFRGAVIEAMEARGAKEGE